MTSDREDRDGLPENEGPQQADPEDQAVTTEHLSEFTEWLEARLDALDTRLDRFDQISTRNTRQFTEDMALMRTFA